MQIPEEVPIARVVMKETIIVFLSMEIGNKVEKRVGRGAEKKERMREKRCSSGKCSSE